MAQLHTILALAKGMKSQEYADLSSYHKLSQKHELFNGLIKTYRKLNEDGEDLPSERKRVQQTVPQVIAEVRSKKQEYLTIEARREWTNCAAKADIVVNGQVLVGQVPVTYLLFLEKQLVDLRTFIEKLPTLDTAEDWMSDANSGLFKTAPVETHRTKKVESPIVLYEATKEHPAQTQMIVRDVLAGYWSTVKESGAMPLPEHAKMLERVESLLRAVKTARETANSTEEVKTPDVAAALLGHLFG
jgi:hypothetical protein